MKKIVNILMLLGVLMHVDAQNALTLDSCRAMALRNNKQINAAKLKKDVAYNLRKSARTKYLPKIDAMGGYEWFSREISLLNGSQKTALGNVGSTLVGIGTSGMNDVVQDMVSQGQLSPEMAEQLGQAINQVASPLEQGGNALGQQIVDAFHTNTHNIWAGAVMFRQPIYMGGAIEAANKMADIGELMAENNLDMQNQSTLYNIDQAYWMVVSLRQKQKLAISYRNLVKKLDSDVRKMIRQGVATKADGLKVAVKVNEADMQMTQVEDGLTLAKMLLCQLCGIPMNKKIILADEDRETPCLSEACLTDDNTQQTAATDSVTSLRPELRMLQNTIDMAKQSVNLARAASLPKIALTGGYIISNPNVFNGFQRKFNGTWNIGVMIQVPMWTWMDGAYKVRAAKAAANMAQMDFNDMNEKIQLQIAQSQFKLNEAMKRLSMAKKNINSAEENLRCANLGFKEGVMGVTDVMTAQTAWQQAKSQEIDAEIDVKLSKVGLDKALGTLR